MDCFIILDGVSLFILWIFVIVLLGFLIWLSLTVSKLNDRHIEDIKIATEIIEKFQAENAKLKEELYKANFKLPKYREEKDNGKI